MSVYHLDLYDADGRWVKYLSCMPTRREAQRRAQVIAEQRRIPEHLVVLTPVEVKPC